MNNTITLNNYRYIFTGVGNDAIIDTTILALIATPVAGLLGVFVAWLVVTRLQRTAGAVDFLGMLGMALPGTVVGIGYLIVYTATTTLFGLPLIPPGRRRRGVRRGDRHHHGLRRRLLTRRSAQRHLGAAPDRPVAGGGVDLLGQSEAAPSGASPCRCCARAARGPDVRVRQVDDVVSAVIFLTTPSQRILTSQIYAEVDRGRFGNAFAFCTILIIIVLLAMLVIHLITRRMEGARQWQAV